MSIPTISFLGTIISFTVTFSRSRIPISISWCLRGINAPDSLTRVFSSSLLKWFSSSPSVLKPSFLSRALVIRLIDQTTGYSSLSSGLSMCAAGNAIFSG